MWPDTDVYGRAYIESAICSRLKHPPAKYGISVSYNHSRGDACAAFSALSLTSES